MSTIIRRANLCSDRNLLIDFFARYLTPTSNARRFDWLYRENPCGVACAWIAENSETHEVIGAAAAFPRRFYFEGSELTGFVLGDFCIHPGHRSMGPALQLQRACLEHAASGTPAVCYDFPSESMLAVYRRLGANASERMVRLAKPLRINRAVAKRMGSRIAAESISAVANVALAWRDKARGTVTDDIERVDSNCGPEFSALAQEVGGAYGHTVARSAEYLNWRFLAHPSIKFEMLAMRRNGKLIAYVSFTHDADDARIVDLFGVADTEVLSSLLMRSIELLRQVGVATVSASLPASHPNAQIFNALGFRERESCPLVTYPNRTTSAAAHNGSQTGWFLMDGDRDS